MEEKNGGIVLFTYLGKATLSARKTRWEGGKT